MARDREAWGVGPHGRMPRSAVDALPPEAAGDLAYRRFCRPDLSPYRPLDHADLVARARVHLARASSHQVTAPTGPIQVYTFEPLANPALPASPAAPRTHVLIHGWTSEAALMAAFVEPLRARGDRVVAFDLPAHGRSPGPVERRAASLVDCAVGTLAAVDDTRRRHGRIDSIIAHSLGAMIGALVVEGGVPLGRAVPVDRMVLVAAPDRVAGVARRYGARTGLSRAGQQRFERRLERVGRRPLDAFTTARLIAGAPQVPRLLIVHATDDDVVPAEDARSIAATVSSARLELHDGLGHAKVLYAPPVVRSVRDFVTS